MSILDYFRRAATPKGTVPAGAAAGADQAEGFQFSRIELPVVRESRQHEWVDFGEDNLYPQRLMELFDSSAIHAAICVGKAQMAGGAEMSLAVDPSELGPAEFAAWSRVGPMLEEARGPLAFDWTVFGAMALEVTWSRDFSHVARARHVPVMRVRAGRLEDGASEEYFYSRDWSRHRTDGYRPVEIAAFDRGDREHPTQLLYVRNARPDVDYYGVPDYQACLSWVQVDSQMALFHSSNIQNGFAPSFVAKFYNPPPSEEAKQFIVSQLRRQFAGAKNAGKAIVLFSDGKENAPDIEPMQVSNLDKQFLAIGEEVVQQIISGHRVTSPMLLGIALPGKLGYSGELEASYRIFEATVIRPARRRVERLLTQVASAAGVTAPVVLSEFNPTFTK